MTRPWEIPIYENKKGRNKASSASRQYAANSVFWLATRAGKMERYCPPGTPRFVPANKISSKFKRVHESFLCLYETKKASTRMKTKKTKMLVSFKNTFCNDNRQTQEFVLNLKIWIWIWNVTNQMIVFSAFMQSGYWGTRNHFSI